MSPLPVKAESATLAQTEKAAASSSLPWQLFSSTSGRYIVDLPGIPEAQTSTSMLLDQELSWHMNAVTLPAIDAADRFEYYLVAYIDIPRSLRYEYSPKALLDAAIATIASDIQDAQLSDTLEIEAIAYWGMPARLLTGAGAGQYVVMTLSMTGDRLYLLLAIDDDLASFEHFFTSFTPIPQG